MWQITEQIEKTGRLEFPTRCKRLKFFPIEGQDGSLSFGKLGFLLLQVIVKNERGTELKLRLNASEGVNNPKFSICQPDSEDHPWIWVGEGRKRRRIKDTLAPKERIPGKKNHYENASAFRDQVKAFAGEATADEILGLFAARLASIVTADTNKKVYVAEAA